MTISDVTSRGIQDLPHIPYLRPYYLLHTHLSVQELAEYVFPRFDAYLVNA
jgi:hypothetical protein